MPIVNMTMRVPAFPGSVVVCAAALAATEEYAADVNPKMMQNTIVSAVRWDVVQMASDATADKSSTDVDILKRPS